MIQLVIPMAGLGTRFRSAGYLTPKPLIEVHGVEMYKLVISNLFSDRVERVVLLTPRSFNMKHLDKSLSLSLGVSVEIIELDELTSGPATTVSLAQEYLDPSLPLVVANSDQYVAFDPNGFYESVENSGTMGVILTMRDDDPKWSFVQLGPNGRVSRIVEKEVISDMATVGIYGFKRAEDFTNAYKAMVEADFRVNEEFYVAPAYEFSTGFQAPGVGVFDLGPVGEVMFGLGIPDDLNSFMLTEVSKQAAARATEMFRSD